MSAPLLVADHLTRRFALPRAGWFGRREWLTAVSDVSLTLQPGETLGIVGESGSGKSTLARLLMALDRPDEGRVLFEGHDLNRMADEELRKLRRRFQMIFQDPFGSLDPRLNVARIVAEPLEIAEPDLSREARRARVAAMLAAVGLGAEALDRYPHEFSGGQRQRIAIARAFVTNPRLVVADEPVSALDVSIQAQILNLLADLKAEHGTATIFVSHNLAVVRHVADRVLVMLKGKIVEEGPVERVFEQPEHPYTKRLLEALLEI